MRDVEPVFRRMAKIVMASSVVAGTVAGIAGLVGAGRRTNRSTGARNAAIESLDAARSWMTDAAPDDAVARVQATMQAAERAVSERKRPVMSGSRFRKAQRRSEHLRDLSRDERNRLADVAAGLATDAIERLGNVTVDGQDVRTRARASIDQQRTALDSRRRQMQEESAERLAELRKDLAGTVEARVKPAIARAGENAEHLAEDLSTRLRSELKSLTEVADQRRPQLGAAADHASARIRQILQDADASSEEWRESAEQALRSAEQVIQENAAEARTVAGKVGGKASEEGRNLISLLFWLTVAGGLVYTVLLNDAQKRKAKEIGSTIWHEGRELYRDIQGQDAEFD